MDRPVLKNEDALRAIGDEVVRKLHDELLKLGLVQFDSGYASIRQGYDHAMVCSEYVKESKAVETLCLEIKV